MTDSEERRGQSAIAHTARLALRHFTIDDAPFVLRLLNDANFLRFIGDRGVRNLIDAENYLRTGPMASYETHGHGLNAVVLLAGNEFDLTVVPGQNRCVGMCGILQRDYLPGPDLGYAFLPEFTGLGLAEEAARAALKHARDALQMPEMLAIVQRDNLPSIKLLHKLGFARAQDLQPLSADGSELLGFRYVSERVGCYSVTLRP
jgi:RimJ/RimL family protein N-acetyltransferase